jgi:peroxiredoxin Q/BCP
MMSRIHQLCAVSLLLTVLLTADYSEAEKRKDKVMLKEGDAAPDFSLKGSDGQTYTLGQYRGEKLVVLAFFPKAFTPG